MCAETDEEARRRADGIPFFQFALRFYGQQPGRRRPEPGTVNVWDEYEKWKRNNPDAHARVLSGGHGLGHRSGCRPSSTTWWCPSSSAAASGPAPGWSS